MRQFEMNQNHLRQFRQRHHQYLLYRFALAMRVLYFQKAKQHHFHHHLLHHKEYLLNQCYVSHLHHHLHKQLQFQKLKMQFRFHHNQHPNNIHKAHH